MATKKKAVKLPAVLKVQVYANLVAASADLIVAACDSAPVVAAWSADSGAVAIDRPFQDGLTFRATPRGLAVLPGGRFVQASSHTNYDGTFPGSLAVFGLDGAVVGKLREGAFGTCATSADGSLVAVVGEKKVALWSTAELIAGGKPFRELELPSSALCFTPDNEALVAFGDGTLCVAPVQKGAVKQSKVASGTGRAGELSVSRDGLVCASDASSAVLLTLGGKKVREWNVHGAGFPVEHAVVTADGLVIAAAGALGKHYDLKFYSQVKFPAPKMIDGFVAVLDAKGKLLDWKPRAKNKPVRAMALAAGRAVVLGQDSCAELVPWPIK